MSARAEAATANAVAPSTLGGLHWALKKRLAEIAARFPQMETKSGGRRAPQILDGWPPPKTKDDELFPFLMPRPAGGEDSAPGADESSRTVVSITIGTYSDTDDGVLDVLAIVDAIRIDFADRPNLANTAFDHVGPLSWSIPQELTRPYWFAVLTTNWSLPRPPVSEASYSQQEEP